MAVRFQFITVIVPLEPPVLKLLHELQAKAAGARAFEMRMRPDNPEHRLMYEDAPELGSPEAILEDLAARYILPLIISPSKIDIRTNPANRDRRCR